MRYRIDESGDKPAYIQLYTQLRGDITAGFYAHGAKLPSKRLLAEESGTSVITAGHAYALLCDEGYVLPRERSGYFVIYRRDDFLSLPAQTAEAVEAPEPARGISSSARSDFPFSVLAKTMRAVLLDYGERILVKPPNRGCMELRQAICAYLARSSGVIASPAQIVVGAGAEYLYSLVAQLLGKDRAFALEDPSYEKIRRVYEACGARCEMLPIGRDGIHSRALAQSAATVLHVTPFNSYPSGVTATASKRNEYLQWAKAVDGFIVEDNYDSELSVSTKAEDTLFSLDRRHSVLYLNTFSHTIAPSVRIGYIVLPERLLDSFEEKLGFYSCTVPAFEQYVVARLLDGGDFERHVNRVRRARRKGGI